MTLIINGEKIDKAEIDQEMESLRSHYENYVRTNNAEGSDDQLAEWSKENIIERTLLKQEAAKDTEPLPEEELKKALEGLKKKSEKEAVELQLKIERLIKKITDKAGELTEEQLKEYYDSHQDAFKMPEQIHVRHIEKHVQTPDEKTTAYVEMINIKEQLDKGESFEKLADENSDCSNNDLGYFPRGQMVQEFEDIVFAMNSGDVSDVFLTPFGYHIAKVYDKKDAGVAPFEETKNYIQEQLSEEMKNSALEDFVDDLKGKSEIKDS